MTSNKLKIIAIITMIIDHFGYYFNYLLSDEIYLLCRIIGRIAMPIFTFLIIEGYFHTSNFNRYVKRLGIIAILTQLILIIFDILAGDKAYNFGATANIVFSFIILLILLKLFEKTIENKNFKSKLIFVMYILIISLVYNFINFDYGIVIVLLGSGMYIAKKYVNNAYIYKILICILITIASIYLGNIRMFAIFSCIPIVLYNGKLGIKSKLMQMIFYYIFPIQHLLLYGIHIMLLQ